MANSLENIKRAPMGASSSTAPLTLQDPAQKLPLELMENILSYLTSTDVKNVRQLNKNYRAIVEDTTQLRFTKATNQLLAILKPHLPKEQYELLKECAEGFQEGAKSVCATPVSEVRFYNTKEARDSFRRLLIQCLSESPEAQTALANHPSLVLPYEFNHILELATICTQINVIKNNPMLTDATKLFTYQQHRTPLATKPAIFIKDLVILEPLAATYTLKALLATNAPLALELTQRLPPTEIQETVFCRHAEHLIHSGNLNEALEFLSYINDLHVRSNMIAQVATKLVERIEPNTTIDTLIECLPPYLHQLNMGDLYHFCNIWTSELTKMPDLPIDLNKQIADIALTKGFFHLAIVSAPDNDIPHVIESYVQTLSNDYIQGLEQTIDQMSQDPRFSDIRHYRVVQELGHVCILSLLKEGLVSQAITQLEKRRLLSHTPSLFSFKLDQAVNDYLTQKNYKKALDYALVYNTYSHNLGKLNDVVIAQIEDYTGPSLNAYYTQIIQELPVPLSRDDQKHLDRLFLDYLEQNMHYEEWLAQGTRMTDVNHIIIAWLSRHVPINLRTTDFKRLVEMGKDNPQYFSEEVATNISELPIEYQEIAGKLSAFFNKLSHVDTIIDEMTAENPELFLDARQLLKPMVKIFFTEGLEAVQAYVQNCPPELKKVGEAILQIFAEIS